MQEHPWPANANTYERPSRESQHGHDQAAVPGMLSTAGRVNRDTHRLLHELSLQGPDHNRAPSTELELGGAGSAGGRPALSFAIETRKTPREWRSARARGKAFAALRAVTGMPLLSPS